MEDKDKKYLDLWAEGVQEKIMSGEIKVTVGQLMVCGAGNRPCHYVGHTERAIDVVHWQGSEEATKRKLKSRLAATNPKGKK